MFADKYRSMFRAVSPDPQLIGRTLRRLNDGKKKRQGRPGPVWLRPVVIAASVLVCLTAATPVLAANVPEFYALLYAVSPATAQFFMPVRESCVDNGVKMEVLATYIHADTAEIFISLQDLEGGRVDATTDLFDSYSINRPFDSSATCSRVDYDPETKTATFLIYITEWGGRDIRGDKLTFSLRCFISDKHVWEGMPVDLPLTGLAESPATYAYCNGYGGLNFELYYPDGFIPRDTVKVLEPGAPLLTPAEGIDITGIGRIDGLLHIQTAVHDGLKGYNHCWIYLKDEAGNERQCDFNLYFKQYGEPGDEGTRTDYCDFVFDIPPDELSGCKLYGNLYTSGLYTEGFWQVTFPMTAAEADDE